MPTPSERAYQYGKLSHAEYASWYGQQIGVVSGDLVAAGEKRTLGLIEKAVEACLPAPIEEVVEVEEELATPEDIGDTENFPAELTYDAMTAKELKALCKDRGLPVYGTKAELALRLKRDDEGISESPTETEAPADEAAAEEESDTPADEAAVTIGETNDENSNSEQELIDEKE